MELFLMVLGLILVFCLGALLMSFWQRGASLPVASVPPGPIPRGLIITSVNDWAREIEFVADRATADRLRRLGTVRPLWRDYNTGDTHWILYISKLADWDHALDYVLPAAKSPTMAITYHQGSSR